jgi:hypothetical protein
MAGPVCTLDDLGEFGRGVDCSFSDVVAGDEKSGFGIVRGENVEDVGCVALVGAIVIGYGYGAGFVAGVDTCSAIWDGADFRSSYG